MQPSKASNEMHIRIIN